MAMALKWLHVTFTVNTADLPIQILGLENDEHENMLYHFEIWYVFCVLYNHCQALKRKNETQCSIHIHEMRPLLLLIKERDITSHLKIYS